MEEEIDASPTSQKKRKKSARHRMSQKAITADREKNLKLSIVMEESNNRVDQSTDNSNCSQIRNNMWQSAYLLEQADKVQPLSKKRLEFTRCNQNEFRLLGPADFLTVSQLCASQPSTSINRNEVQESQWDVSESQFQKLDDAVKEFHESEMKNKVVGTADVVQMDEAVQDESINTIRPLQEVVNDATSDQWMESEDVAGNSLKRNNSVLQSILYEWSSSSPVKIKKTECDVQISPQFKFNKKRIKRTYSRKRDQDVVRRSLTEFKKSSPKTGIRLLEHEQSASINVSGMDEFNESMNIVDNIRNLSEFFSQPIETIGMGNNVDETVQTTNINECQFSVSTDDEAEFLGFDDANLTGGLVTITLPEYFVKCDRKLTALASITLPTTFYEFDLNTTDDSTHSTSDAVITEHDLLADDDDIFANFQTQLIAGEDEVNLEQPVASTSTGATILYESLCQRNLPDEGIHIKINAQVDCTDAVAVKTSKRLVNIFEDIEKDFDMMHSRRPELCFNEPFASTSDQHFLGFASADRNFAPVSAVVGPTKSHFNGVSTVESVLKPPNNCLDGIDSGFESFVQKRSSEMKSNVGFAGFTTATGKQIHVSSTLLSKQINIFQDVAVTLDELNNVGNWISDNDPISESNNRSTGLKPTDSNVTSNPTFSGFTTARGGHIPVSSELMSKKINIFDSVRVTEDELNKMDNWMDFNPPESDASKINQRNSHLNPNAAFTGFTTARRTEIAVSPAMMANKTNIFQNVTGDELTNMDMWICDNDRMAEPNVHNDFLSRNKLSEIDSNAAFVGFTTGRGTRMPLSSKKINIFDDVTVAEDEINGMNHWINDSSNNIEQSANGSRKRPLVHHIDTEETNESNSIGRLREVTNIPQRETENLAKKLSVNTFIRPSPMRKMSMMNSLRKWEPLKENVKGKSSSPIAYNESVVTATSNTLIDVMTTPTSSKPYVCVTPTNTNTYTQICRESAAAILEDDEMILANRNAQSTDQTPGFVSGFMAELTASSTPINKTENFRNRPKQRRLVETFDDIAGEEYLESNGQVDTFKVKVSSEVATARKSALTEQQRSVKNKSNVKPVPSSLFVKKLTSTTVNWKEFVDHNRPVNLLVSDANLTSNVLNVTAANATKFKFNAWDDYPEEFCRENISGIYLKDDIVVMMDEHCQIGINEISSAFLSCPSVDPKLVHYKWIENHMKWIVIKLAAMERSFPHQFAGRVLTLHNFMLQMKYRYEREIDRAERSAIRRICEMDDIAEKRMILFVAAIRKNGFSYDVELSDGWYSLQSTFEVDLKRLIDRGKIKVGTKLVTQGANVKGLDNGCHPLDASSNIQLQLHANSTRRVRWDAKLGYCKNPSPFHISLRSVCGSGGTIPKLRICVLRVYPVVYMNAKNWSEIHSEKVEARRSLNEEREVTKTFQKLYNQVSKEVEDEEKAARSENHPRKMVKLSEISSIEDPVYLFELLNEDKDPERIENELSNTQRMMVMDYRHKMQSIRNDEILERVKAKLDSIAKDQRKYIPLLKFKVTDHQSFDKRAIVMVWKPSEDILSLIKEESVFDMTGAGARGVVFNELQIYAGKDAVFQKLNVANPVPVSLLRHHISIFEILTIDQMPLNDLDTTGCVVCLSEIVDKSQRVYIADSDHNIMCVNFSGSVQIFACDDIVQPKRILAFRNLKWRSSSKSEPIPCAYASEYSIFTEHPQSAELSSAMKTLRSQFVNIDLDAFIEKCMETVSTHNPSLLTTPNRTPNSTSLLPQSSVNSILKTPTNFTPRLGRSSSLTNQSRIERLNKLGDPNPMSTPPPLNINSLNKSFKLPVSKT